MEQPLQQIRLSLVPDTQPTAPQQPGKGGLHHPAVPSEPLAVVDPASCKARGDTPSAEGTPQGGGIVGLVRVELGWSLAGTTWSSSRPNDRGNRVNQREQLRRVVRVSGR